MAQEEVGFSNAGASKGNGGCSARLRRIGRSVCNTEKGEFFGRTASSWAKIGIFYIIFYACLAGFFAAMLVGFFATLDDKSPTQKHMYSLIKGNPGMGFRPLTDIDTTLIKVKSSTANENVQNVEAFMNDYKKAQEGAQPINCSAGGKAGDDAVCQAIADFGPCTSENKYGYESGKPCVLLKLNRVYDWAPKPFENMTGQSEEVQKRHTEAQKILGHRFDNDHVGVSCEGENDGDADNLGPVNFYPSKGFPMNFYPYKNQAGYRSPIVFAEFTNLTKGVIVQVWCKLWAANIKHHRNDRAGSAHFEILLD